MLWSLIYLTLIPLHINFFLCFSLWISLNQTWSKHFMSFRWKEFQNFGQVIFSDQEAIISRRSHYVLQNRCFAIFTGKHMSWNLFLIKLQAFSCNTSDGCFCIKTFSLEKLKRKTARKDWRAIKISLKGLYFSYSRFSLKGKLIVHSYQRYKTLGKSKISVQQIADHLPSPI